MVRKLYKGTEVTISRSSVSFIERMGAPGKGALNKYRKAGIPTPLNRRWGYSIRGGK